MSQVKEQNKITAKYLNETEINNRSGREFKVMIIETFTEHEKGVKDI